MNNQVGAETLSHGNADRCSPPSTLMEQRQELRSVHHKGEFWKPCPGTGGSYYCCGYQIITPLTGCGMYCSYCALHAYFDRQHQVQFENWDDLETEIHRKLAQHQNVVRFGTGEFADSLLQEPRLGLSRRIAALLAPYKNVVVEFKTKSVNVEVLKEIENPGKVVIGFSMNTPAMITALEHGTALLEQRLKALRRCEEMGFWVAIHFDPMVWHEGWEAGYRGVVRQIFDSLQNSSRIAWWSMGGFRCVPELKRQLQQRREHLPLFAGELILGEDRKYRYFRPIRTAFYKTIDAEVRAHNPEVPLYLCMESEELWEESAMVDRIPDGLTAMLDKRAKQMLNI